MVVTYSDQGWCYRNSPANAADQFAFDGQKVPSSVKQLRQTNQWKTGAIEENESEFHDRLTHKLSSLFRNRWRHFPFRSPPLGHSTLPLPRLPNILRNRLLFALKIGSPVPCQFTIIFFRNPSFGKRRRWCQECRQRRALRKECVRVPFSKTLTVKQAVWRGSSWIRAKTLHLRTVEGFLKCHLTKGTIFFFHFAKMHYKNK